MIDPAFQLVLSSYMEPHRHYHNIDHIIRMLKGVYLYGERGKALLPHDYVGSVIARPLYEAILFHDVIYRPIKEAQTNEEMSAVAYTDYIETIYGNSRTANQTQQVVDMIMATERHFDPSFSTDDYLTNLLLDLDLLAFTDPYDDFYDTQAKIDNEYLSVYPEEYVTSKRIDFLNDILNERLLKFRVIDPSGVLTEIAYNNISRYLDEV